MLRRGFGVSVYCPVVKVFEQKVDRQRVRCSLDSSQLKIDVSGFIRTISVMVGGHRS